MMQQYQITEEFLAMVDDTKSDPHLRLNLLVDEGEESGAKFINSAAVDTIAEAIQFFIADVVATLIDAGSEREAVMENEELTAAITKELNSWTEKG